MRQLAAAPATNYGKAIAIISGRKDHSVDDAEARSQFPIAITDAVVLSGAETTVEITMMAHVTSPARSAIGK